MMDVIQENKRALFSAISDYWLEDLQLMLDSADYTTEKRRLAVPIAQTCFSLLDLLGMLHSKNFKVPQPQGSGVEHIGKMQSYKETGNNLSLGMELFTPSLTQNDHHRIIQYFRHGVTHYFLPYKGGEIMNDKTRDQILSHAGTRYILNVHPLAKELISNFFKYITMGISDAELSVPAFEWFVDQHSKSTDNIQYCSTTSSVETTTRMPDLKRS